MKQAQDEVTYVYRGVHSRHPAIHAARLGHVTPGNENGALTSKPLLIAKNLTKSYGAATVVDQVSFTIQRGETLGLVGESGSGKSTIARMLLRLIEPTSGSILFDGQDVRAAGSTQLRALRRRMQMVFQDPYGALNPRMRIGEIVAEPFAIHGGFSREHIRARVAELLAEVGLDPDIQPRYPHEFSGGQRQRINIARALALQARSCSCSTSR